MNKKQRTAKAYRVATVVAMLSTGMAYQAGGCSIDVPDFNTQVGFQVEQDPRFYESQDRFYDLFDRALGGFGQRF